MMARMRHITYLGIAMILVFFMVAFMSDSFSLNNLLHPAPRLPRIGKPFLPVVKGLFMNVINFFHSRGFERVIILFL